MQYTCQAPVYSSLDIAEKVVPRSQFNESLKRFVLVLKWVAGKLETVVDYGQTCCDIISLIQHLERGNVEKPAISEVLTDSLVSGDLYRVLAEELFAFSLNNSVCSSHEDVVTFLINRGATFPSYFDLGLLSALPIHQESHCIMVEAIMKLHLRVTMTCESVSLSRSEVLGDREMPISWTDVEAILLSWINDTASCVNEYLSVRSRANHQVRSNGSSLSLDRCRPEDCLEVSSASKSSRVEVVPMAEDVCQDLCDGQSLLSILSFYFPSAVPVHSVCLKKLMSFSDCVKNVSRVHEFCTSESYSESCANVEPWLLGVEELIYPNLSLKVHVVNALVQLFLALKHTPLSLTLMPPHIQLPNSEPSSETKVVQAGQDDYSDTLDGQELSPNQRSMSMSSFNNSRASLDTAGDALMELENRWTQNPQNSSHSDSQFPDNNNQGCLNTLKKPREPSEDSAIGTMSTTSDTSTRDCRLSLMRVDSGTKTYSKSNSKTSSNRTSVHELIDSYEQEPRPLSAMKQADRNLAPASERRSNQSGSSSTGNSGNVRTFARPKSAFGERTLVGRNKYEDSDDTVSEAEMRVGLSGQDPLQVCSGNDLGVAGGSSSTKLSAIKQKMEERRKKMQMERTRLELARSQQRQKMGKTAFMRVMKRGCENAATSECSSQAESEEEQQKLKDDDSSDQSSALDLEVLPRHSNQSERSNRRERAKSTHLEAMGYMSGPEMLDNSPRKRSMEIQTSINFDDRGRSPAMHKSPSSTFTRGRPISCVERDDMDSWSSGFGSNQSTLRRTKALTRPVTEDRHSLQHTSSSMDLRSSLERDMLIEHNQLLSRELETLKQKFAVELETRKLNSEREQFELQRQFELNKHSNNVNNMINNAVSNHNHPQAQYWNMSPSNPNQNRLPLLQQPHPVATHQPPLYAMTPTYVLNSPGQIYPNRNSATLQFFPPHQPAVHQRKPFYPYQQVQPPYALHEQEVYHNYETTHKQEYNYETLHGSHHSFYQQPYPSYPHHVSSTESSQVPHAPSDASHNVLVQKPSATPRTSHKSLEPDTKFAPMNHKRSQGQRPQSLPMATGNGFQHQNLKGTAKDTFDSTSVVSPLDPDVDVSSSVEVTPESSPVRQQQTKSQLSPRNQERPNSLSPRLIIEPVSKHQDAPPTVAQDDTGTPKPLRKGGEAFAVNFSTSASNGQTNGSSKEMSPKNRFNMHKRAPVKKSTAVAKDNIYAEKRARESPPNRAVMNASSKSSNLVDEALKIVKEGELDLSVPCKKGGVALIIDVESVPVNATQTMAADKRREKEQEFLRRQHEKKQKDLERRQKLSEAANAASQQRLTQQNQTQQLKRQEAAARRERIMAQYLQKKAEKELEDSGIKVGVPKGVVGRTTGFKFVSAGNESVSAQKAPPKPRSRSTTSESGKKMTKVKESGVGGNSEMGHSMTTTEMRGKGRVAASRSRRNSIENLLSDGESVASSAVDNWDSRSEFSEYNGPKLFVKPSSKSNKQKIQNAITQCVFPGAVNSEMKQKILQELDNVSGLGSSGGSNYNTVDSGNGKHFLILFRDHSLKYRAIYLCAGDCSEGEICKVVGTGPSSLKLSMIQDLYKYDSGGKRFVQIPAKTMSVSVDAFTIHNQLWKKK